MYITTSVFLLKDASLFFVLSNQLNNINSDLFLLKYYFYILYR